MRDGSAVTTHVLFDPAGHLVLSGQEGEALRVSRQADGTLLAINTTADGPNRLLGIDTSGSGDHRLAAGPVIPSLSPLVVSSDGALHVRHSDGREPARLLLLPGDNHIVQWQTGRSGIPVSLALDPDSGVVGLGFNSSALPKKAPFAEAVKLLWATAAVAVLLGILAVLLFGGSDEPEALAATDISASVTPAPTSAGSASALVAITATRPPPPDTTVPETATTAPAPAVIPTEPPTPTEAPPTQTPAPTEAPPTSTSLPPTPVPPTPTVAPSIPALITAALPEYAAAAQTGNGAYFLGHLHPIATQFYGLANCQGFFTNIAADPTFAIQAQQVTGPAAWTWVIYGQTVGSIPDAYTVSATLTQRGQTVAAQVHFAWDGKLLVFSPCVRPPGQ